MQVLFAVFVKKTVFGCPVLKGCRLASARDEVVSNSITAVDDSSILGQAPDNGLLVMKSKLALWVLVGFGVALTATFSCAAAPKPGTDANGLLPAGHNPAAVPAADDAKNMVPAVEMSHETREAILLFDAAAESDREYDLINCLDGMTFGFGNWPQAEAKQFFNGLLSDLGVASAFTNRAGELLEADSQAKAAFVRSAKLPTSSISRPAITKALSEMLAEKQRPNIKVTPNGRGGCQPLPKAGASIYQDYKEWLRPVFQRAFRDPAIVSYQVRYWEDDVLSPAREKAKRLGVAAPVTYLLAFYQSNPGQAPEITRLLKTGKPPREVTVAGASWKWDTPPKNIANSTPEQWHSLLLWQAMCPAKKVHFRIRNRNIAYFEKFLSADFKLPDEAIKQGKFYPKASSARNCDPRAVRPRDGGK
ncbi:hypothetical protein [Rhizobium leguminosarum]|uniref:hypothetical protein n=1 Tax=Rhizobium leguminosarum TaxID=384 RepID=UPI00102F5C49|nr:hypothetical protein [Rhizobium leguminosarum]TAY14027.1 hypothetical protein ELH96_20740 [Rhizobium leguminosarum]